MFETTQELISKGCISAGHDISDGGIVTCLSEMAFAGNCGIEVQLESKGHDALATLFAEELGCIIEVHPSMASFVLDQYHSVEISCTEIGNVVESQIIKISVGEETVIQESMTELRDVWESTSFELEKLQCANACVAAEQSALTSRTSPFWSLSFTPAFTPPHLLAATKKIPVAIVRAEGSNGDREMAAAVYAAGMQPWDVMMEDLLSEDVSLDAFNGLVFVGGFSFADVLDSAKGWSGTILFNKRLKHQFEQFYARPDTFSLGVCNGCQLMALLGIVPGDSKFGTDLKAQPRFIHNTSGRFESRWTTVRIEKSDSIWLQGMEESVLGIWSAHGEGRVYFPDPVLHRTIQNQNLAPIRYCDVEGKATERYPDNPNGSPSGIAALCSSDGRHLAMMPHPERCFLTWQLPWYPKKLPLTPKGPGPWLKMFQNARQWHERNFKI